MAPGASCSYRRTTRIWSPVGGFQVGDAVDAAPNHDAVHGDGREDNAVFGFDHGRESRRTVLRLTPQLVDHILDVAGSARWGMLWC